MGHKTPYKAIVAFIVHTSYFISLHFIHLPSNITDMMICRNVMDFLLPCASLSTVCVMMPCRAAYAKQKTGYRVKDGDEFVPGTCSTSSTCT